jgi:hypothetical protein
MPDGKLAIKVKSRSNTMPTGGQPSLKTNTVIHWKSPAEGHLAKMAECEPQVTYLGSQPARVYFTMNGEDERHHVPDLLCRGGPYPLLFEVKTELDAWCDEVAMRSALMARDLPMFGYGYRVALAEDLRREPRMRNLKQIRRLARAPANLFAREATRLLLAECHDFTWGEASRGELGHVTLQVVCRLLLEGVLWIDVDQVISANTRVTGPSGG